MSPSALALIGYAAWTLLLLVAIILFRTVLVLKNGYASNSFAPWGEDVSPFSARLCRAHANCYENLAVFAALILLAMVTGHGEITDPLARWVLAARVAQSVVHLISTSEMAVNVRVTFLLVQLGIEAYWIVQLGLLGFS
jgi:uncharacterized MAPEG superfamily protein